MRQLTLLSLFLILFSCGETKPEAVETITAETSQAAEAPPTPLAVKVDPSAQVPTMPKGQIEQTAAEAKPELIDASKILKESPAPRVTRAEMAKPAKPAPKATTVSTSPAPNAPVAAPAAAPAKVTLSPSPAAPSASTTSTTTEAPAVLPPPMAAPAKPNHTDFNTLLSKYVNSSGNVNYAGFKKDEAKLDVYLASLSENSPQSNWGRNESMAFWINAYNANTLKLILKNYPVKSITDLDGGKPWDVKWIKIGGKTYSLNNIEHDIIRPRYKDARIHFAVNCAAASCPPLPNKAFTAANLNSLLESRTKSFVRNGSYNTISGDNVKVSKIFDWYGEDFGDLRKYLNKYTETEIAESTEIGFKAYDWALNKQ